MEDTLLNFVETAINEKTNQLQKLELPRLTDEEVRVLSEKAGLDLSGFRRVIDNFGVRHAMKKHGNEYRETLRGQVAIQPNDFILIFSMIVEYEEVSTELNRIGNIILRYKKNYTGFRLILAEEIRTGRKEIAFQTLYKQKIRRL